MEFDPSSSLPNFNRIAEYDNLPGEVGAITVQDDMLAYVWLPHTDQLPRSGGYQVRYVDLSISGSLPKFVFVPTPPEDAGVRYTSMCLTCDLTFS